MSDGFVIGDGVGLRYLKDGSAGIVVMEFVQIHDHIVAARFTEQMWRNKRYRYHQERSNTDDIDFSIRAEVERKRNGQLLFQIESRLDIVKARRFGIDFRI